MTEFRAQDTNKPIRAQILEALRKQFQDLRVGDGYAYDYNWCEIADDATIMDWESFAHGNSILIVDQDEALSAHLRTDVDEPLMRVEIMALVRDETGEKRYLVVSRVMADIIKGFFNFRTAQNGVLIGPAQITNKDTWDQGNQIYGVTCSAEILYQYDDGNAYALT